MQTSKEKVFRCLNFHSGQVLNLLLVKPPLFCNVYLTVPLLICQSGPTLSLLVRAKPGELFREVGWQHAV